MKGLQLVVVVVCAMGFGCASAARSGVRSGCGAGARSAARGSSRALEPVVIPKAKIRLLEQDAAGRGRPLSRGWDSLLERRATQPQRSGELGKKALDGADPLGAGGEALDALLTDDESRAPPGQRQPRQSRQAQP